MDTQTLLVERDSRGVVTLTMNRPDRHNAFDELLIAELNHVLTSLANDESVRLLILRGRGRSFSAGADLDWMKRMACFSFDQNLADSKQLALLMHQLDEFPCPTVAVVQGAAMGGGVGLVACCDIALASATARFALSEVRLGLVPAVISPYVVRAIGARQARRYCLSAEVFTAQTALQLGLIHQLCDDQSALEATVSATMSQLLSAGPQAQRSSKQLIRELEQLPDSETKREHTAQLIARVRSSAEAAAGIAAFFDKKPAPWQD